MGKALGFYLIVAHLYLLVLLKRNIFVVWALTIANILLFIIESWSTRVIIGIFCLINIFMLSFIEHKNLSTLFRLYAVPDDIRLTVRLTIIFILSMAQLVLLHHGLK